MGKETENLSDNGKKESRKLSLKQKEEKATGAFQKHIEEIQDDGVSVFSCRQNECKFSSIFKPKAINHALGHECAKKKIPRKLKPKICNYCTFVWHRKGELRNHMKAEHKNDCLDKVICVECGVYLATDKALKQHVSQKHIGVPKKQCEKCSKVFNSEAHLNRHVGRVHSEKTFLCEQCVKQFSTEKALKKHVKYAHEEKSIPKVKCEVCTLDFQSNAHRERHYKTEKHKNKQEVFDTPGFDSVFKCDDCEYGFKSLTLLHHHKIKAHGPKNVNCDFCPKAFKTNFQLLNHMRLHDSNAVVFPCNWCDKVFKEKRMLTRHFKVVHEEKKIKCSICSKLFKDKTDLKRHMKFHDKQFNATNNNLECTIKSESVKIVSQIVEEEVEFSIEKSEMSKVGFIFEISSPMLVNHDEINCNTLVDLQTFINSNGENVISVASDVEQNYSMKLFDAFEDLTQVEEMEDDTRFENVVEVAHQVTESVTSTQRCLHCGKEISGSKYHLQRHKLLHDFELINCEKCNGLFKSQYAFNGHQPCYYNCEQCFENFFRADRLKDHISKKH